MTDLVEGFEACLMQVTLTRRGVSTDVARVDEFVETVERELLRVHSKPGVSDEDKAATRRLADVIIDRARKNNAVLPYSPAGA